MNLRVLVVDDEVRVADSLQAYLENEGMYVRTAGSAEEAWAIVQQGEDFDVCIMDMCLPGMAGDAATRRLYRVRPGMRYIIHTGTAGYGIPDDLRALGIDNHQLFMKPLPDMTPLVRTIHSLGTGV